MGWTAPRTWVAGEIVTAALMNTHIRDNVRYLKGLDGVPTIQSGLTIANTSGDERLLLPLLSTVECATVLNAEGEVAWDEQTHRMKAFTSASLEAIVLEADVFNSTASGASHDAISAKWAFDHVASSNPHTVYPLKSILSSSGDIPYLTGALAWAALARGTANQRLSMNATASAPTWATVPGITIASNNYTGNNTTNKAIAHGLGAIPKLVLIYDDSGTTANTGIAMLTSSVTSLVSITNETAAIVRSQVVTTMNSTNFYVGLSGAGAYTMNITSDIYNWVALA